jgi:ABC-type transport system substrate-binding protein
MLRAFNFNAQVQDALDPHLTQYGPVANMHSAVFSKLLRYDDEVTGTIAPDLAEALPEQPDALTYIFKLRDGVRFHNTPRALAAFPLAANRALEASDVKYSFERQMNGNSPQAARFFRSGLWNVIDRIEAPDVRTLTFRLKRPVAPFAAFLASRHAFVLPREVVDRGRDEANSDAAMIGTGPFLLEAWAPGVAVRLRRNPRWFARNDAANTLGGDRPFIDGYDAFYAPQEDVFQRAAFDRRLIDTTGFTDPTALDLARKTNLADIALEERRCGGILASRFLLDRPPFRDDRVRRAIHLAVDRRSLADLLYPPIDGRASADLSGAVAPAMERWATPPAELAKRPGYGAARKSDITEAKQLWAAALGDAPIGELAIFFAGVPRIIPERAVEAIRRQLFDVLGVPIRPTVDASGSAVIGSALGKNIEGATEGTVSFTFMLEDGGVDLDEWVYPHFRSGDAMNTYRLQDPTLDALLDKQRAEFDEDARRKIGLDVQEYLLANVNARIEYLAPVDRRLTWGYVRNSHHPLWNGSDFALADTWLDATHPAWQGRPA